jgi:hypothetical protein
MKEGKSKHFSSNQKYLFLIIYKSLKSRSLLMGNEELPSRKNSSSIQFDNISNADSILSTDNENEIENDDDAVDINDKNQQQDISLDNRTRVPLNRFNDHLKSQDFQVCVTIIEARQLPGLK